MQLNPIHHGLLQSALSEYSKRSMPERERKELFRLQAALMAGTFEFTPRSQGYNLDTARIERTEHTP